jgi:uncharacterized membrane protein YqjE
MEMYMEDVGHITAKMITLMQTELSKFGIEMTTEKENEIWDEIFNRVELVCPNDYKHHN